MSSLGARGLGNIVSRRRARPGQRRLAAARGLGNIVSRRRRRAQRARGLGPECGGPARAQRVAGRPGVARRLE
jgi:hypothetical protein